MAEGLERDTELLEIQEVSLWRQPLLAAAAGLFTAGPIGLIGSLVAFRKLEGNWLPWTLIGVLAAPPLAYGQWMVVRTMSAPRETGELNLAALSISEADKAARACALALRTRGEGSTIRNPVDGQELFCDPSNPSTVVITSKRFEPLGEARACGDATLSPGTRAAQWLVSPAGTLVCKAVGGSGFWWGGAESANRQALFRRCTENLRLEAQTGFTRTAHQLGRPDYCAEERALLARDQINQP